MKYNFIKLNHGWNADPNVTITDIHVVEDKVILSFENANEELVWLLFPQCWRYRLGGPNDEGWYKGQGRFSTNSHKWGEFYEVEGNLKETEVSDWKQGPSRNIIDSRHYLFYMRDSAFECDASNWKIITFPQLKQEYGEVPEWKQKRAAYITESGGVSDELCYWKGCSNFCLKEKKLCVDHLYPELSGV